MRTVLFLCSGNYYRSRFAEILFNALAAEQGLPWRAESRGLTVDRSNNPGPISPYAVAGLRLRGVEPPPEAITRMPRLVTVEELAQADRVIALKEAEHRPALAARFPGWEDRVTYWHIHDLDQASAAQALSELDAQVRALVASLAAAEQDVTGSHGAL